MSNCSANISIPKNEMGILNATQKASLIFKKIDNKISTNKIPIPPFSRSKLVLCFRTIE